LLAAVIACCWYTMIDTHTTNIWIARVVSTIVLMTSINHGWRQCVCWQGKTCDMISQKNQCSFRRHTWCGLLIERASWEWALRNSCKKKSATWPSKSGMEACALTFLIKKSLGYSWDSNSCVSPWAQLAERGLAEERGRVLQTLNPRGWPGLRGTAERTVDLASELTVTDGPGPRNRLCKHCCCDVSQVSKDNVSKAIATGNIRKTRTNSSTEAWLCMHSRTLVIHRGKARYTCYTCITWHIYIYTQTQD